MTQLNIVSRGPLRKYDPPGQTYVRVMVEVTAGERMPWSQR